MKSYMIACLNCRFFKQYKHLKKWGSCFRYPPTIIETPDEIVSVRPEVEATSFCGEIKEATDRDLVEEIDDTQKLAE